MFYKNISCFTPDFQRPVPFRLGKTSDFLPISFIVLYVSGAIDRVQVLESAEVGQTQYVMQYGGYDIEINLSRHIQSILARL
jgi:hypothetical protein